MFLWRGTALKAGTGRLILFQLSEKSGSRQRPIIGKGTVSFMGL